MIEVSEKLKKAFMTDNVEKQVRITFPNGEHAEITNEHIVANTFSFAESLCSQETLKFGLCEANVFKVTAECGNIKGCIISVFIDVFYDGEVFEMPLGMFKVDSCKRQAGTHLRNIEAYTESVTENDVGLPEFQSAKFKTPFATTARTISYGFNKFKAELFQEKITDGTILDFIRSISTDYRGYLFTDEKGETHILRIYYKAYYENTIDSWVGDFNNPNRLYQTNVDYTVEPFKSVCEELQKIFERNKKYIDRDYKAEEFVSTCYILENRGKDYKEYERRIILKKDRPYSLYFPNVARGTVNTVEHARATISVPTRFIYDIDDHTAAPQRRIFDYDVSELTTVVYKEIEETLPPILIPLDQKVKQFNTNIDCYMLSDEAEKNISSFNILNGYLELQGMFAKTSRDGKWEIFTINDNFALYPQDEIYPNEELYPVIGKNYQPLSTVSYKSADYEEFETHKYGYVRASYLASDNEKYSITVLCNSDYDNVYEMTNNYLLMSRVYSADEVRQIIKTLFYPNIKDIAYNPANLSIKGLPFIEAGDVIKVFTDYKQTFKTFVFRRTLTGEQLLVDKIEAKGEERTKDSDKWIDLADDITKG